jgi:Holliday junction resolvase RusA-like endonuclease
MNKFSFAVDLRPQVKERPRMTRRGRVYTPAKTLDYERSVAELYDGPMFEGPIFFSVMFAKEYSLVTIQEATKPQDSLRGDLDNYVKAITDGLQGQAYVNDRQIVRLHATRH